MLLFKKEILYGKPYSLKIYFTHKLSQSFMHDLVHENVEIVDLFA